MPKILINSGIKIVGRIPWGSHICQFYHSKKDLLDILLPYFKEGLKNNESCMWITSEPLNVREAKNALNKKVKDLNSLIDKGQIEILNYSQWYAKSGGLDTKKALTTLRKKEQTALKNGFSGLRLAGNTFWLEKKDWKDFTEYEAKINNTISSRRMLAICTYSLDKCSASDVIDVVNNHQFALIKRDGKWVSIENPSYRTAINNLKDVSRKYQLLIDHIPLHIAAVDKRGKFIVWNRYSEKNFGYKKKDAIEKLRQKDLHVFPAKALEVIRTVQEKGVFDDNVRLKSKDGSIMDIHLVVVSHQKGSRVNYYGFGEDITERKRLEEKLKTANEELEERVKQGIARAMSERQRLYTVLDTLPVYVIILDNDYRIPFANKFFIERFGKPGDRLCHKYLFNRQEPCENCQTYKVLKTRVPHNWEWTGPDGRNYIIFDYPFIEADSSFKILEVGIDITEQKKLQNTLQRSNTYHRNLIEVSIDPLVTIDSNGKIMDVNKATEQVTGFTREELAGTYFSDYFTEPEKARIGYKKVFKEGTVKDYELEIRHKDGHLTQVLYNASVYHNESGEIAGIFASAKNITKRKFAEKIAREANTYNRNLIEASPDPLVTISSSGIITDVNKSTAEATGRTREELIGTDFCNYFTDPDNARIGYQQVFAKGFVKDYPLTIRHKDGRLMDVLYNATIYRNTDGKIMGVFAAARDVTARKKAENDNIRLQKELLHLSRVMTMGELTATLAHELNQPLLSIRSNAQAAQRFMEKENPDLNEIKDILSDIIKDNRRASDVIIKIRALMKNSELQFAVLDINDVIREVIPLVHSDMVIKNISLITELSDNIPHARGDRMQLQEVILNLILNSFEAMKDTDPKIIHIRTKQENDESIRVSVKDSGTGLNKKNMQNLFKPFFTTKEEGLGMGLVISRTILESHGGSIEAENNLNGGMTFHIILPVEKNY